MQMVGLAGLQRQEQNWQGPRQAARHCRLPPGLRKELPIGQATPLGAEGHGAPANPAQDLDHFHRAARARGLDVGPCLWVAARVCVALSHGSIL